MRSPYVTGRSGRDRGRRVLAWAHAPCWDRLRDQARACVMSDGQRVRRRRSSRRIDVVRALAEPTRVGLHATRSLFVVRTHIHDATQDLLPRWPAPARRRLQDHSMQVKSKARVGIPRTPKRLPNPNLTPQETVIMWLVVEGFTNDAIADEIDLSAHTVKFHVNNALYKLGYTNRTGGSQVRLAERRGGSEAARARRADANQGHGLDRTALDGRRESRRAQWLRSKPDERLASKASCIGFLWRTRRSAAWRRARSSRI